VFVFIGVTVPCLAIGVPLHSRVFENNVPYKFFPPLSLQKHAIVRDVFRTLDINFTSRLLLAEKNLLQLLVLFETPVLG
jgi:hypothetical protein